MVRRHTYKEMRNMNEISNYNMGNTLISELFMYGTEYGELQCHRLNVHGVGVIS